MLAVLICFGSLDIGLLEAVSKVYFELLQLHILIRYVEHDDLIGVQLDLHGTAVIDAL